MCYLGDMTQVCHKTVPGPQYVVKVCPEAGSVTRLLLADVGFERAEM